MSAEPTYPGFVIAHESEDGKTVIEHRDGIPWHDAPCPPRLHRCRAQSNAWFDFFSQVQRCACGAIRSGRTPLWAEKNSRRKSIGGE